MKKTLIVLISALILLGSISIASAAVYVSIAQRVYFTSTSSSTYYWAFIKDATPGATFTESKTSGFLNYSAYLTYNTYYWQRHVAYIYQFSTGRYEEALAMRDVNL